jgi:hypothetical protein
LSRRFVSGTLVAVILAAVAVVIAVVLGFVFLVPWSDNSATTKLRAVPMDAKGRNPAGVPCPAYSVNVFLKADDAPSLVRQVVAKASVLPGVQHAVFVSQDESFTEFSAMFKDRPPRARITVHNIPPSERLVVDSDVHARDIKRIMQGEPGVEAVVFASSTELATKTVGSTYLDVATLTQRPGVPGAACR